MRIMGLDYGSKTVGVAISDAMRITAQGIEIIRRKDENKLRQTLARIEELIEEYEVTEIVLGLPKNMNDTMGPRAEATLEFKEKLERRTGLPVHTFDEDDDGSRSTPGTPEGICGYDCCNADFTGIS